MTANVMKGDRERCLAAGMDDYLPKPITSEQLYEKVERFSEPFSTSRQPLSANFDDHVIEDENAAFDYAAALNRLHDDEMLLQEIMREFCSQCPTLMAEIEKATADGDHHTLERAAHTLKGSADVLFARDLVRIAASMERSARNGDLTNQESELSELQAEMARVLSSCSSRRGISLQELVY
jgi:HPt (histidine-containing phosphotransfer) domain-containing protein